MNADVDVLNDARSSGSSPRMMEMNGTVTKLPLQHLMPIHIAVHPRPHPHAHAHAHASRSLAWQRHSASALSARALAAHTSNSRFPTSVEISTKFLRLLVRLCYNLTSSHLNSPL